VGNPEHAGGSNYTSGEKISRTGSFRTDENHGYQQLECLEQVILSLTLLRMREEVEQSYSDSLEISWMRV